MYHVLAQTALALVSISHRAPIARIIIAPALTVPIAPVLIAQESIVPVLIVQIARGMMCRGWIRRELNLRDLQERVLPTGLLNRVKHQKILVNSPVR